MAGTFQEKWRDDFHPVDGAYRQRFSQIQCFFTPVSTLTKNLFKKNSTDWDTAKSPAFRKKREACKQTAKARTFFYMT